MSDKLPDIRANQEANNVPEVQMLKRAEALAEWVAKSSTYGEAFKDEDGKINPADVVTAVVLGSELGIPPMSSILLGKRLNANAYFKVMQGRALGLNPVSALNNISVIDTAKATVIHTGVHVITKCLIDAGIDINILKDYEPVYGYVNIMDNKIVDVEVVGKDKIYEVTATSNPQEITKAKTDKKILVKKKEVNRVTEIEFKREERTPLKIKYSLREAIDAGLYKGVTTDGQEVKGKDNWNNHPATMLRNRAITIGGRIIAADRLQGIYSTEEASEFTKVEAKTEDVEVEDVTNLNHEQQD